MDIDNWEILQNALASTSEDNKQILDSSIVPGCVDTHVCKNVTDLTMRKKVIRLYTSYLLNIIDQSVLISELRTLGIPNAAEAFIQLNHCIQIQRPVRNDSEDSTIAIIKNKTDANNYTPTPEQTHSSDQASILQNRVPVPPNPTPPKWGSD